MTDVQHIADEFFESIPDALLINMALHDWISLKKVCIALTLDLQLIKEQNEKNLKN